MPGEDAIHVPGEVTRVRVAPRLFEVTLENGHVVLAHVAKRDLVRTETLAIGARVELEMSPFDMAVGRIRF